MNVSIDKTGPASATLGDRFHYRITATNHGSIAAPATAITDAVPNGLSHVTWSCTVSDGSSCTPSYGTGNTVRTTATIPPGGTAVVHVAGTAAKIGAAVDDATITICRRCTADDRTQSASVSTDIRPSVPLAPTGAQVSRLGAAGILLLLAGAGVILPVGRTRSLRRRTAR